MKQLYSIKDTKGGFYAPQPYDNDALAVRDVKTLVNGGKSIFAQYPEDFELWCIGQFDEVTGTIHPEDLRCVVRLNVLKAIDANA